MKKTIQLRAIFKGRVQGVFFRQHVKDIAEKLKITGYVKNLKDGFVEVLAIGNRDILEKFLNEIEKNPRQARIDSIEKKFQEKDMSFDRFEIRY